MDRPSASETTERAAPVWMAVMVTVTPGSTAPFASVMVPT